MKDPKDKQRPSQDGTEKWIDVAEMVKLVRTDIATTHYKDLNDPAPLQGLGIDPKVIKRKGGRPPARTYQENPFDGGDPIPVYTNEQIVELVFKQKWQGGKPFSNSAGYDYNECFYRVADNLKCNASQIAEKWKRVPKQQRDKLEVWLVRLLYEHEAIHKSKLKKAKRKLGIIE